MIHAETALRSLIDGAPTYTALLRKHADLLEAQEAGLAVARVGERQHNRRHGVTVPGDGVLSQRDEPASVTALMMILVRLILIYFLMLT